MSANGHIFSLVIILGFTTYISKCAVNMPNNVISKEEYLKKLNVPEFACLQSCDKEERISDAEELMNQRPVITKCEARELNTKCIADRASLVTIHDSKYVFVDKKVTFHQAVKECRKLGLLLVTVESEILQRRMNEYMDSKKLTVPYWSSAVSLYEGASMWLENGMPVASSIAGKKSAGNALSFTMDSSTKKLKFAEEKINTQNFFVCEVADECFINRCVQAI